MTISHEAFKQAQGTFVVNPSLGTAAMYFSKAREAEENGVLGDDDWLNACADIEHFLWDASKDGK